MNRVRRERESRSLRTDHMRWWSYNLDFNSLLKFYMTGSRTWNRTVHREKNLHWFKTAGLAQKNGPKNILCHRKSLELLPFHNHRVLLFLPHMCRQHSDQVWKQQWEHGELPQRVQGGAGAAHGGPCGHRHGPVRPPSLQGEHRHQVVRQQSI